MAYDKHIFKSGDVLLAAELNTMNNQIELNHDSIQNCYTKEEVDALLNNLTSRIEALENSTEPEEPTDPEEPTE